MKEIETLENVGVISWFLTGLVIICCLVAIFTVIDKFLNYIGKPIKWFKKQESDHELLIKLVKSFDDFKANQEQKNNAIMEAQMESMCDRIEQKCKSYIELNGIPEDEYDSFVRLFKAYQGINGNHGAEAKYNYCITNLKIIPSKSFK